jgi:hypothetical protein
MDYLTLKIKTLRFFETSTGSNISGDMSIQNTVVRNSDLTENRLQVYSKQEEVRLLKASTRTKEGTKEQTNKHLAISAQIYITVCLEGDYRSSVNSDLLDDQGSPFSRSKILLFTSASRLLLQPDQFLIQRLRRLFPQR